VCESLNHNIEYDKKEQELLIQLELHMKSDYNVPALHKAFIASREEERTTIAKLLYAYKKCNRHAKREVPQKKKPSRLMSVSKRLA
jgi:hypothetical protein